MGIITDAPRRVIDTWGRDNNTIHVGPGCNYTSIQDAIDAAEAGDTIVMYPGTYTITRALRLKPNMTLRGSGRHNTIIRVADVMTSYLADDASSGGTTIYVESVEGFEAGQTIVILPSGYTYPLSYTEGDALDKQYEIAAVNPSNNSLTLTGTLKRAFVLGDMVATAFNAIELNTYSYAGTGATVTGGITGCTIESLEIDGNSINQVIGDSDEYQCGIHMAQSDHTTLRDLYIHDTVFSGILDSHYNNGTEDRGSRYVLIDGCRVENASAKGAIHLHGTQQARISNTLVIDNSCTTNDSATLDYFPAIYMFRCRKCTVSNNDISGWAYGIGVMGYCTDITITDNLIHDLPGEGVRVYDGSSAAACSGVAICDNIVRNIGYGTTMSVRTSRGGSNLFGPYTHIGISTRSADYSTGIVVRGNVVDVTSISTGPGLAIGDWANGTLIAENSVFSSDACTAAIYTAGQRPIIVGNKVSYQDGYYGIMTYRSGGTYALVAHNTVTWNGNGAAYEAIAFGRQYNGLSTTAPETILCYGNVCAGAGYTPTYGIPGQTSVMAISGSTFLTLATGAY